MSGVGFILSPGSFVSRTTSTSLPGNRCANRLSTITSVPRRANARGVPTMGLFGLGLPEVAVVAGIGIFLFGPKKIADMGKELGGMAGSVKKATSEFQDAMEESIKD